MNQSLHYWKSKSNIVQQLSSNSVCRKSTAYYAFCLGMCLGIYLWGWNQELPFSRSSSDSLGAFYYRFELEQKSKYLTQDNI